MVIKKWCKKKQRMRGRVGSMRIMYAMMVHRNVDIQKQTQPPTLMRVVLIFLFFFFLFSNERAFKRIKNIVWLTINFLLTILIIFFLYELYFWVSINIISIQFISYFNCLGLKKIWLLKRFCLVLSEYFILFFFKLLGWCCAVKWYAVNMWKIYEDNKS